MAGGDVNVRIPNLVKQIYRLVKSEEVRNFLRVRHIFRRVDGFLDRIDHHDWSDFGRAALGPEPCEFISNVLLDSERKMLLDLAKKRGISARDVWEAYNVLSLQLESVADCAVIYTRDRTLGNRANFSTANMKLSQLAVIIAAVRSDVIAQLVRESDGSLDDIYQKLISKFPDLSSSGVTIQVINDADDFMADLKTEYAFGRVSPNLILFGLVENGLDLEQLYKDNQDV
ncbi:MAG: hypothetical protein GY847_39650, partial [Proteobacteria bacterium]|nr:hypothetical protein [Pseudomonadota bacterium]